MRASLILLHDTLSPSQRWKVWSVGSRESWLTLLEGTLQRLSRERVNCFHSQNGPNLPGSSTPYLFLSAHIFKVEKGFKFFLKKICSKNSSSFFVVSQSIYAYLCCKVFMHIYVYLYWWFLQSFHHCNGFTLNVLDCKSYCSYWMPSANTQVALRAIAE